MPRLGLRGLLLVSLIGVASCSSKPNEVGVFAETANGWVKIPSYDWESWAGGYEGTQGLAAAALPVVKADGSIYLNKVPVDASALYWGRNPQPSAKVGMKWRAELDSQPAPVKSLEDGTYEVSTKGLSPGTYGLVAKASQVSYRAYFFQVR